MASPSRGLLRPAHTPLPDIDDLFTSHHPFLHSKWFAKNQERCTKKPLAKRWGVDVHTTKHP